MRRALVLGGTGTVGSAVLGELARAGVPAVFTYHSSHERAQALADDVDDVHGSRAPRQAMKLDLADMDAVRARMDELVARREIPDIVIHCAAVASPQTLEELTDAEWARVQRIGCQSVVVVCQRLAPHWRAARRGDVVLVGALDRAQSLPLPLAFAASQGALSAVAMALANQLGPYDIRVNMVALGLLGQGLSTRVGTSELYRDFEQFSALRRAGTPAEAARVITWLALGNRYMNGKVVPVNGGI